MPLRLQDPPASAPPNPERAYRKYLGTCRRFGLEPMSRERAQAVIGRVSDRLAGRRTNRVGAGEALVVAMLALVVLAIVVAA